MRKPLRIAVRADASSQIGLGHAIRCIAIIQGFEEISAALQIDWYGLERSMIMPLFALLQSKVVFYDWTEMNEVHAAYDLLISDVQARRIQSIQQDKFTYRYHLAVDDLATERGAVTGILNGTFRANDLRALYERMESEQLFLGTAYYPLRSGFQSLRAEAIRKKRLVTPRKKVTIVISIGGSDPLKYTEQIIQMLSGQEAKWRRVLRSVTVLLGPGVSKQRSLYIQGKIQRMQMPIKLVQALQRPEKEFIHADVLLTSGGGALYEAACLGCPVIAFMQTPAEQNNVSYFEKAGIAVAGVNQSGDRIYSNRTWKQLNQFLRQPIFLSRRSNSGIQQIDGKGAKRLAGQIMEKLDLMLEKGEFS